MSEIAVKQMEEPEATAALMRTGLNITMAADILRAPGKLILRAAHGNTHSIIAIHIDGTTLVLHLDGGTKEQRARAYRAICEDMGKQTGATPHFVP